MRGKEGNPYINGGNVGITPAYAGKRNPVGGFDVTV